MNAKQFLIIALFALLFSGAAFALEDYTPQATTVTTANGQTFIVDSSCAQTSALVSQLTTKIDQLQNDTIKLSDFSKIKDDFFKSFSEMFNTIIVQQVTVLFVFTILFFCLLFIAKARRLI